MNKFTYLMKWAATLMALAQNRIY